MIVKVNRTFLTLTGHAREDIVGRRTFSSLLTAGGRIYHETHYAPMLRMQGRVREIALDVVCADGRRLPVLVNSVLERDADGAPRVIRTSGKLTPATCTSTRTFPVASGAGTSTTCTAEGPSRVLT